MHLEIDGLRLEHRVNPRMKHAYLQVQNDGTVVLKSNGRDPDALRRFVLSKRAWIERQQARVSAHPAIDFGRTLLFKGNVIDVQSVGVQVTDAPSEATMRKQYDRFYRDSAEAYLYERTQYFATVMGLEYQSIRLRKMRRRWGSCSKAGEITYNTLLMQLPEPMIDYTIVHELAHLVHFNHSKAFHALVESYLPGEKKLRMQMRDLKAVLY
jgi:predicted metal-dependent hydrolase